MKTTNLYNFNKEQSDDKQFLADAPANGFNKVQVKFRANPKPTDCQWNNNTEIKMEAFKENNSRGFLQRQKVIIIYYVKKFVKKSQFLLFSRQKVYKNANSLETLSVFIFITEIL